MLAESEMERQRWVGALNELQKLLRRNKLPFKFVSTDYVPPSSGGDILFLPCPSVRLAVCPSVTLRFRSITQVPFDPEPSNFIG